MPVSLKRNARNGHRSFTKQVTGKKNEIINDYLTWMFLELAAGSSVELHGIGLLYLKWRKGRTLPIRNVLGRGKDMIVVCPNTWTLKIKTSAPMRKALNKLAEYLTPETGDVKSKDTSKNRGNIVI